MKPPRDEAETGLALAIVLSLITCGIYSLFWQSRIFNAVNALNESEDYSFWPWLLFTLLTCGIYNIFIQYKLAQSFNRGMEREGLKPDANLPLIAVLCTLFGLQIVVHALEQSDINKLYA